ncbi:MAG: hypothetical protein AAF533_09805 [Acidobacteriota bacterium]
MPKKPTTPDATLAHLFPDLPVPKEKRLHFESEALAQTLGGLAANRANGTPFTVVVRGGWGRG